MSIIEKRFSAAVLVFVEILFLAFVSPGQEIEAIIKIHSPDAAQVEGRITEKNSNQSNRKWTFTNSIAGVENLAARVSDFHLSGDQNREIEFKKLADGEYLASEEANFFNYRVNLKPLPNVAARAHASFFSNEHGLLMLGDLLPQFNTDNQNFRAQIKFDLPVDWKIVSNEKKSGENVFQVKNIEKAVFLVGKNWREQEIQIGKTILSLVISGEWQFSDAEALKISSEIFEEYLKLFGEVPAEKVQVFLMRFPKEIKFGRWEAETRGANLIVFSGDMPFKSQSMQRLHEQLRHELFHLWMPNNLALTGNYDWFYEGFTVYQALRTGISMNQIRFEDYLDTLAQAYNLNNLQSENVSLIESSKNRWRGANSQIYARGMLIAFLCDIALLRENKGKQSISTIFREIYQKHRVPNQLEEGNVAILKILKEYSELNLIIEKYVKGAQKFNWKTDLESIGIEAADENFVARLRIKTKLNGKQKDLLNNLGYNNWRKISEKRK
jgi:predicted metalloprotease with PDZ domain